MDNALEAMLPVCMLTFDPVWERRFSAYLNSGTRASSSELSSILPPNGRNLVSKKQKGHRQKPMAWCFMVPQIRFERTTPALGERCSIP